MDIKDSDIIKSDWIDRRYRMASRGERDRCPLCPDSFANSNDTRRHLTLDHGKKYIRNPGSKVSYNYAFGLVDATAADIDDALSSKETRNKGSGGSIRGDRARTVSDDPPLRRPTCPINTQMRRKSADEPGRTMQLQVTRLRIEDDYGEETTGAR